LLNYAFETIIQPLFGYQETQKYMAFNWGIIGLGKIARKFADALSVVPDAQLQAVASRSAEKARQFGEEYGVPHHYGAYADMVHCPDLHAVYVATPHALHHQNTLMFLRNAIPVLCEKPFAMNGRQVAEMIAAAHQHHTFLMEALWTRFLPTTQRALEIIQAGQLGDLFAVKADFGFAAPFEPEKRLFNPDLGGGALLDIGIYPVFLAQLLLGSPDDIVAHAHLGATRVDEDLGAVFSYRNGQTAHLHASFRYHTKTEAFIYGSKGTIHLHTRWHEPTTMSLLLKDERPQHLTFEYPGNGYDYEIREVMRCVREGQTEHPDLPLQFSRDLMATLDRIRQIVGLKYPGE